MPSDVIPEGVNLMSTLHQYFTNSLFLSLVGLIALLSYSILKLIETFRFHD